MGGMGPPPKSAATRRRTNATVAMSRLPPEGRTGPSPHWPLPVLTDAAAAVWADLWASPQAAAWERLGAGTVRVVARYALLLGEAEAGDIKAATEVRQLEDRLGLTPMSMLRLRWEVATDELAEARAAKVAASATSARSRMHVVDEPTAAA